MDDNFWLPYLRESFHLKHSQYNTKMRCHSFTYDLISLHSTFVPGLRGTANSFHIDLITIILELADPFDHFFFRDDPFFKAISSGHPTFLKVLF
jgi:hypothetical protein